MSVGSHYDLDPIPGLKPPAHGEEIIADPFSDRGADCRLPTEHAFQRDLLLRSKAGRGLDQHLPGSLAEHGALQVVEERRVEADLRRWMWCR